MMRNSRLVICFLAIALTLSLFAVSCTDPHQEDTDTVTSTGAPEETTTQGEQDTNTQDGSQSEETVETTDGSDTQTETETEPPVEHTTMATVVEDGVVYPYDPDLEAEEQETEGAGDGSCHPKYAYDAGYHWSPDCKTCGRKASAKIAHTVYCTVEDEGDVVAYSFFCYRCDQMVSRKEVSYDASLYLDPATLIECKHNFSDSTGSMVTFNSIPAAKFTSANGTGSYVTLYEDSSNSLSTGKYMVIKIKLGSGRSQFRLAVSSVQSYADHMWQEDCAYATVGGLGTGWSTAVIDLTKLVDDDLGYTVASDGEYYLCSASIYLDRIPKNDSFQIAYVAFCHTMEEVRAISAGDNVRYIYDDIMSNPLPTSSEGTVCQHTYEQPDDAHHSSEACDVCHDVGGVVEHSYNLIMVKNENGKVLSYGSSCLCGDSVAFRQTDDSINFYSVPGQYYNNWATDGKGDLGVLTGTVMCEGNVIFSRVNLEAGGSFIVANETATYVRKGGWDAKYKLSGGTGKYAVFKLRASGDSQLGLIVNDTRTSGWSDGIRLRRTASDISDNTWRVYVVDLEAINYKWYVANDKKATDIMAGFMGSGGAPEGDRYIDLAYFTICDDWAEVAKVAFDETEVYLTEWTGEASLVKVTPKGECYECVPKFDSVTNGQIKYVCAACEKPFDPITVPSNVNFYSVPGQYYNNWKSGGLTSDSTPTGKTLVENGVIYNRISLSDGGSFALTNGTADYVREWHTFYTLSGGTGQYAVFKLRAAGDTQLGLLINDGSVADFDIDGGGIYRQASDVTDGTWRVYVVDLKALNLSQYTTQKTDHTQIQVGFKGTGSIPTEERYVDLAYFAICDNWTEVAAVATGEQKVYYTTWAGSASLIEMSSDGKCSVHTPAFGAFANGTYTYNCSVCGTAAVKTISTPKDVNYYSAPGHYYNNWATGGLSNHETPTGFIAHENGVTFSRISLQTGGSFQVTNGTNTYYREWKTEYTITGGSGKFAVFKIRCKGDTALSLILNDGNRTEFVADNHLITRTASDITDGTWRTYVVDLEALAASTYVANANAETVTSIMVGFKGSNTAPSSSRYLDLAYFAICDNWTEVAAVATGEEKVYYTTWRGSAPLIEMSCDGKCSVHTPKFASFANGTYTYNCTVCGAAAVKTLSTPKDVNFYSAPGHYYNNWVTCGHGGSATVTGTAMAENGMPYSRITLAQGASFIMGNGTAEYVRDDGWDTHYTLSGGTGKYAVFKLRAKGDSGLGLVMDDAQTSGFNDGTWKKRTASDISDNAWRVYVVDLEALAFSHYGANDGTATQIMAGFKGTADALNGERYVDLAYFAICDNWTEVEAVVGAGETVLYTDWVSTENDKICYSNGTDVTNK